MCKGTNLISEIGKYFKDNITKWQVSEGLRKRNIPPLFDCWTCYRILFWHIDDLAILKLVGRTYAFAFLAIA